LRAVHGVASVNPGLTFGGTLTTAHPAGPPRTMLVNGTDAGQDVADIVNGTALEGRVPKAGALEAVMGQRAATAIGVKLGDSIIASAFGHSTALVVVGIVPDVSSSANDNN